MYKIIQLIIVFSIIFISCKNKECDVIKDRYYNLNIEQKDFLPNYSEDEIIKFKDINNNIINSCFCGKNIMTVESGDSCGIVYFQHGLSGYCISEYCGISDSIEIDANIKISSCKDWDIGYGMDCRKYGFLMELEFKSDVYGNATKYSFSNDNLVCSYDSLEIDNHTYKDVYLYEIDSNKTDEYVYVYKIYYSKEFGFLKLVFSNNKYLVLYRD